MNVTLIENFDGSRAPLYFRFSGQVNPQTAYMYFNPQTGEVQFDYSYSIGRPEGTPMAVWNSLILRWEVPNNLSPKGIRELFEDVKDDLSVIADGFSDGYDDRMNHVGNYSEEAKDAIDAIDERLWNLLPEDYDRTDVWEATEWAAPAIYDVVREYREADDKDAYIDEFVKEAEGEGVVLVGIEKLRPFLDERIEDET